MPQTVHSDLVLYADDSSLTFQHTDIHTKEHQVNKDFANLCKWFIDNKLIIHFSENKTKCILFGSNQKVRKAGKPNIVYIRTEIKLDYKVTYLGCLLDETMYSQPTALKST